MLPRTDRLVVLILGVAICERTAISQNKQSALAPVAGKLSEIATCMGNEYSQIRELQAGILAGWGKWPAPHGSNSARALQPPPPEYMDSLDRDLIACRAASGAKDQAIRRAVLQAVSNDIAVKASDCQQFGMGRSVPVQVVTLRGKDPDNGWEVYYRWLCSSALHVEERRIPKLTSPATVELPPGEYAFRAQKRAANGELTKTDPVNITVGLRQTVECQLPVP
jgi:hypothetical protein